MKKQNNSYLGRIETMFVGREQNSEKTNAVVAGGTDWLWWRDVDDSGWQ